jgi:hypothetical protein
LRSNPNGATRFLDFMRFGPARRRISWASFSLKPLTDEFRLLAISWISRDQKGKGAMGLLRECCLQQLNKVVE